MKALNLLFLLSPLTRALWDAFIIEEKSKSIDYAFHDTVTMATIIAEALVIHSFLGYAWGATIALCFTTHWLVFDFLLNWFRDKPILTYYGDLTVEKDLSFIERHVYRHVAWYWLLIAKVVLFTISAIVLWK